MYLGREGGASGQYMNIHVDEKELVLEVEKELVLTLSRYSHADS